MNSSLKFVYYKGKEIDPKDVKVVYDDGSKTVLREFTLDKLDTFLREKDEDEDEDEAYQRGRKDAINEMQDCLDSIDF